MRQHTGFLLTRLTDARLFGDRDEDTRRHLVHGGQGCLLQPVADWMLSCKLSAWESLDCKRMLMDCSQGLLVVVGVGRSAASWAVSSSIVPEGDSGWADRSSSIFWG